MKLFSVNIPIKQEICISKPSIKIDSGMKTNKLSKFYIPVKEKKYTYLKKVKVNSTLEVSKFRSLLKIKTDILISLIRASLNIEQLIVPELEEFRDMYLHNYFIYENIDKLFDIYKSLNDEEYLSDMDFELFLRNIDEHKITTFKSLVDIF